MDELNSQVVHCDVGTQVQLAVGGPARAGHHAVVAEMPLEVVDIGAVNS